MCQQILELTRQEINLLRRLLEQERQALRDFYITADQQTQQAAHDKTLLIFSLIFSIREKLRVCKN